MRILVIGINHATRAFANCLASDESNLVFTNLDETLANKLDYEVDNIEEYKEFALANEIDLTILCDEHVMNLDYVRQFEQSGLAIFAPDKEALKTVISLGSAKRFMYKNKIQTTKFGIFDRFQASLDWARAQNGIIKISADCPKNSFKPIFCETFAKTKKAIENFFEMNLRTVVLEVVPECKNYTFYAISDGFNAQSLGLCLKEKNFSYLNPAFSQKDYEKLEEIAKTVISSFAQNKKDYLGILGIDFVYDTRGNIFVTDFHPFFKEIDAELFAYSILDDKAELFNSALTGTIKDEYETIEKNEYAYASVNVNDEFYCVYGRTLNEAKARLCEVIEQND